MNFFTINKQITVCSIMMQIQTELFLMLCKKYEYIFPALSICSNPCVGPSPKIKISFFLFSIFVEGLISTPKNITFLPNPISGDEKLPCLSNPTPYPQYLYFLISAFLVKLPAPHKQFSSAG